MSGTEPQITIDQLADSFAARLERGERPSIDVKKRVEDIRVRLSNRFDSVVGVAFQHEN